MVKKNSAFNKRNAEKYNSLLISLDSKLRLIKAIILVAFFAGMLFSPMLWISKDRFFPLIKPIESIPTLTFSLEIILLFCFAVFAIWWLICNKISIGIAALLSLLILLVEDQMRWQPWVYLYLLMLLPYLFHFDEKKDPIVILKCLQWILAGVYVWSGIQKLSPDFIHATFEPSIKYLGVKVDNITWKYIGYSIPIIEIMIGVALLIPKTRKAGIIAAIAMHLIILAGLGVLAHHHNAIVYPWNIAMILFVIFIYGKESKAPFFSIEDIQSNILKMIPICMVWVLPILNLFGYWPHYLSFSLYSGKPSEFYVAIEESQVTKINKQLLNYFADIPGLEGGRIIDVDKWALSELNVPFYSETEAFKKLSHSFCNLGIAGDKIVFVEMHHKNGKQQFDTFNCQK